MLYVCIYVAPWTCEPRHFVPLYVPTCSGMTIKLNLNLNLDDLASSTPDPEPSPPSPRCAEPMPEPTNDGEPEPTATDKPSPHGATVLRITAEPELLIMSDQVREQATTPTMREKAVDSKSVERSSAPCTVAEGELNVDLGLLDFKGEFMDVYADLPPLLPPSPEPSVSPVPTSSPERASVPKIGPERASVPEISTEKAPVSPSCPESDSVPELRPERAPVPEFGPDRAPVPEFSPKRASVPNSSPERAPVPTYSPEKAAVPTSGPERASDSKPGVSKMPTHPPAPASASSTSVVWQPLCSPSAHNLYGASSVGLPVSIVGVTGESLASVSSLLSAVAHQSTGSAGLPRPSGSTLVCRWPSVISGLHSSGCASSVDSTVGHHYGCGLGPAWLLLLQVLLGSSCSKPHLSPPWLLPPSSPPGTLSASLLLGAPPPPEPPPKFPPVPPSVVSSVRGCAFREGAICKNYGLSVCVILPMCSPWPSFPMCDCSCDSPVSCQLPHVVLSAPMFPCPLLNVNFLLHVCSCLPCVTTVRTIKDCCSYLSFVSTFLAPLRRQAWQ